MDEYEKHKQDLNKLLDETDQVIQNLEEFPYRKIAKIINTCSTQIRGLTTSGSDQMSYIEKRVRAEEYLNGAMERILDENYVGLTFAADSDSFDLMNRISRELSDARMDNNRLTGKLVGYSRDLDKLENYIENFRDLNINGNSDLGDNDKELVTSDSPCASCD